MAVYNKKDFELFLNKEKIRKKKIKDRIIKIFAFVLVIALVITGIHFFKQDRNNFFFEDNYTDAMNYAIKQFLTDKPTSHDNYPRLTYNYNSLPPTPPTNSDVNDSKNSNDIIIDYTKNDTDNIDNKNTNNKDTNKDKETNTNNNSNNTTDNNQVTENKTYEYDHFLEIVGKGNYPGYNVTGKNFIKDIRKELCLAIKAYTSMPLASGQDTYKVNYYDDKYDYVYFFLAGEVKKVDKSYLKTLDDEVGKNTYDIYNFWISLTSHRSSKIATNLLSSGMPRYYVIITDKDNKSLSNYEVSFISGSYVETVKAGKDALVIFDNVPFGTAEIKVKKSGFINFPNEIVYKDYETIKITSEGQYNGKYPTGPLKVKLQESSLGQSSFSFTNYVYEWGKDGRKESEELIKGNYVVTLINKETEEKLEKVIDFKGEDIYLCHYFETIKSGIYDIIVYPTMDNLEMLEIKDVYINEYGLSNEGYLTKAERYVFSFNTDEHVNITINVKDSTSYGLDGRKGILKMYQLIETKVLTKEHTFEIRAMDCNTKESFLSTISINKEGQLVGNIDLDQNKKYDIYLSTVFGDILLYKEFNVRTSNHTINAEIENSDLAKCKTDIFISRSGNYNIELINATNNEEKFKFEKVDNKNNVYQLKNDEVINAGYYLLNFSDENNKLVETYIILISEKSNNYTMEFR